MFLQVNVLHTCYEQRTTVGCLCKMASEPADIVHNRRDRRVIGMREGTEFPLLLWLCEQLVMRHLCYAVRHIPIAAAADTEHLVGGEVHAVETAFLHIQHTVRCMLYGIGDHIDVGVDLSGFLSRLYISAAWRCLRQPQSSINAALLYMTV